MGDVRRGRMHEVVGAAEVDGEGLIPDLGIAADERHLRADAGVSDRDVEPSELLEGAGDGFLHLPAHGHITLEPGRAAALGGDGLQQLGFEPEQRHACPAVVQSLREQRSDAASGAGDHDATAGDVPLSHASILRRSSLSVNARSARSGRGGRSDEKESGATLSELRVIASIS